MPRTLPQALPSEASSAGDAARELGRLIGPAIQAPDDTPAAAELLGWGANLAAADATVASLRAQAFASTADLLLSQWEDSLGLTQQPSLTTTARRNRVLAKLRASRGNTTASIIASLTPINGGGPPQILVPTVADIHASEPNDALFEEPNYQKIPSTARQVYRLAAVLKRTVWADINARALVNDLLAQMAPAHCQWLATVASTFSGTAPGRYFDDSDFDAEVFA